MSDSSYFHEGSPKCQECNNWASDSLRGHLSNMHGMSLDEYWKKFPGAPVLSDLVQDKLRRVKRLGSQSILAKLDSTDSSFEASDSVEIAGREVEYMTPEPELVPFIPELDPDFIFDERYTGYVIDALEDGENAFIFGPTGTGKSQLVMQLAATLRQPVIEFDGDRDKTCRR